MTSMLSWARIVAGAETAWRTGEIEEVMNRGPAVVLCEALAHGFLCTGGLRKPGLAAQQQALCRQPVTVT
jgi:hypothetical protein